MPNFVPAEGPSNARVVYVGEAPGEQEDRRIRPFIGPSGDLQTDIWDATGFKRNEIYIDNLHPWMPPGGKIENVPAEDLARSVISLRERIALLQGPHVIVPTGNYATFALTGKGKVKADLRKALGEEITASMAEKKAGITRLRGSVYEYTDLNGRKMKVIPTIHPAYFLRGRRKELGRSYADWRRIKREEVVPELINYKPRHCLVSPTEHEVEKFVRYVSYYENELIISVDIETWGRTLSCVGFAPSDDYSITIPTTTKEEKRVFLPYIKRLSQLKSPKVLQNGLYDTYWLKSYGVDLENWHWDTLAMAHALNPNSQVSLHYLCSIWIPDYRYWKDEAKDAEEIRKYAKDLDSLWTYNGLDCCYTRELFEYLFRELERFGMLDFYHVHYRELFRPLLDIMRHGVRADTQAQSAWAKRLLTDCAGVREELKAVAGEDLFAKKDFSNVKLRKFFYETLKVPKQTKMAKRRGGKVRTETLDKNALHKIILAATNQKNKKKYEKGVAPAMLILDHRRKKKLSDFLKGSWDGDKRIRCSYKFTTDSGRLASSKNPKGKGDNLQNQDKEIRGTFIPDKGCVFVKIDLSQIEDRVCKMYTGADRMIEMANLHPEDFDTHSYSASRIFKVPIGEVTYYQRELGKRTIHGAQRGMMGKKLSENLLTDRHAPLVVSAGECQRMIDVYFNDQWEIRDMYFPMVRKEIWENQCLVNSWGRVIHVPREFCDYDDDFWRQMYSWYLQSEDADWMNQRGVKPIWRYIKSYKLKSRINLPIHDESIISCPPDEAYDLTCFTVANLEQSRMIRGRKLVVPAEVCVANSWKDDRHEWKRMPGRDEFMAVVGEVYKECVEFRKEVEG